jgi:hypothetical protein
MKADASTNRDSDTPDFCAADPDPSIEAVSFPPKAPIKEDTDHDFLKILNEIDDFIAGVPQVHDGIKNELARAVIGNISSPFHVDHFNTLSLQKGLRNFQVLKTTPSAQGEHGRMFKAQNQILFKETSHPGVKTPGLKIPCSPIFQKREIEKIGIS